jgi:hypothetical protein
MAVSGSKNFAITRADIIEGALRKAGAYDQGESVSGDETAAASMALNLMVKYLSAQGADIWLRTEITLFLQPDTQSYALGTAHATTSYVETTTKNLHSTGNTGIAVTSSAGMTAGDYIGIKMDNDTIHWSTIATVDNATQVTINDGMANTSAAGKRVYAYTTKAGRPTKIEYVVRRSVNGYDTEVEMIGERDYRQQSDKSSGGPPIVVWYQPTLTTGTLYVWPVDGGSVYDKLVMSADYYADDLDTAANNPQFPIEWGEPLTYGLADRLAPEYGLPIRERQLMHMEAESKIQEALSYDVENASVVFVADSGR